MVYPIDISELAAPHGTLMAADRLRLALFGFRGERGQAGTVLVNVTATAYGDTVSESGGVA